MVLEEALTYVVALEAPNASSEVASSCPRGVVKELARMERLLTEESSSSIDTVTKDTVRSICLRLLNALGKRFASSAEPIRECLSGCIANCYELSMVPQFVTYLTSKTTTVAPTARRTVLLATIAKLDQSKGFMDTYLPDIVPLATKLLRSSDVLARVSAVKNVTRIFTVASHRALASHADGLKLVSRAFADKNVEVRDAAVDLASVILSGSSQPSGVVALENTLQACVKNLLHEDSLHIRWKCSKLVGRALALILVRNFESGSDAAVGGSSSSSFNTESGLAEDDFVVVGGGTDTRPSNHNNSSSVDQSSKKGFKVTNMMPSALNRNKISTLHFQSPRGALEYVESLCVKLMGQPPITVSNDSIGTSSAGRHAGNTFGVISAILITFFRDLPKEMISLNVDSAFWSGIEFLFTMLDRVPTATTAESVRARSAIAYAIRKGVSESLTENQQLEYFNLLIDSCEPLTTKKDGGYHKLVLQLGECSNAVSSLGEVCAFRREDILAAMRACLSHEKHVVRLAAVDFLAAFAVSTTSVCRVMMLQTSLLELKKARQALFTSVTLDKVEADARMLMYQIHGWSSVVGHVLQSAAASKECTQIPFSVLEGAFKESQRLLRPESSSSSTIPTGVMLTCSRAGWHLMGSLLTDATDTWLLNNSEYIVSKLTEDCTVREQAQDADQEVIRLESSVCVLKCYLVCAHSVLRQLDGVRAQLINSIQTILKLIHRTMQGRTSKSSSTEERCLQFPTKARGKAAWARVLAICLECLSILPVSEFSDTLDLVLELVALGVTSAPFGASFGENSALIPSSAEASSCLVSLTNCCDEVLDVISFPRLLLSEDGCGPISTQGFPEDLEAMHNFSRQRVLSDMEMEVNFANKSLASLADSSIIDKRFHLSDVSSVRMVDSAVKIFGHVFPTLPNEMKQRCLQHFAIGIATSSDIICWNVCAALLSGANNCTTSSIFAEDFDDTPWVNMMQSMLLELLAHPLGMIRRGASESICLIVPKLNKTIGKQWIDDIQARVRTATKAPGIPSSELVRAGGIFALACIKRAVGASFSPVDVAIIYQSAGEISQPVRSSVLHAWSLVLEAMAVSGDIESFVKSSISLIEAHIFTEIRFLKVNGKKWQSSVDICLGQLINSVLAALGPEIEQENARLQDLLLFWSILRNRSAQEPRVMLEYWTFYEKLTLFAPKKVEPSNALRQLDDVLNHPDSPSALQKVSLSCLRLLAERYHYLIKQEVPKAGRDSPLRLDALVILVLDSQHGALRFEPFGGNLITHFGLSLPSTGQNDGSSSDASVLKEVRATLFALIDVDAGQSEEARPCYWLRFLRGLVVGSGSNKRRRKHSTAGDEADSMSLEDLLKQIPPLRWRSKVVALECVRHILQGAFSSNGGGTRAICDIEKSTKQLELRENSESKDFLCLYASELVSLACQSSTALLENIELLSMRTYGMMLLQEVLTYFKNLVDPDTMDQELFLVQYQAQISASIRQCLKQSVTTPELFITSCKVACDCICAEIINDGVGARRITKLITDQLPSHEIPQTVSHSAMPFWDVGRVFRMRRIRLMCLARLTAFADSNSKVHAEVRNAIGDLQSYLKFWLQLVLDFAALKGGCSSWPLVDSKRGTGFFYCSGVERRGKENNETVVLSSTLKEYQSVLPAITKAALVGNNKATLEENTRQILLSVMICYLVEFQQDSGKKPKDLGDITLIMNSTKELLRVERLPSNLILSVVQVLGRIVSEAALISPTHAEELRIKGLRILNDIVVTNANTIHDSESCEKIFQEVMLLSKQCILWTSTESQELAVALLQSLTRLLNGNNVAKHGSALQTWWVDLLLLSKDKEQLQAALLRSISLLFDEIDDAVSNDDNKVSRHIHQCRLELLVTLDSLSNNVAAVRCEGYILQKCFKSRRDFESKPWTTSVMISTILKKISSNVVSSSDSNLLALEKATTLVRMWASECLDLCKIFLNHLIPCMLDALPLHQSSGPWLKYLVQLLLLSYTLLEEDIYVSSILRCLLPVIVLALSGNGEAHAFAVQALLLVTKKSPQQMREEVARLSPESKQLLESELRTALSGQAGSNSTAPTSNAPIAQKKIDLSRYS